MLAQLSLSVPIRTLAWVIASAVLGALALAPAAVLGSWIAGLVDSVHIVRLGGAAGIWAFLATWLTVGLARAFSVGSAPFEPRVIAGVAIAGGIAAAVAEAGLVAWSIGKMGRWDAEYVGLSWLMPLFIAVTSSALAGAIVTAGSARTLALGGLGVGLFGIALDALLNLRGLSDGISESGPLLGISIGASASFGLLATALALRVRRRSAD